MIGLACVFFLVLAVPLVLSVPWWLVATMAAVWLTALVVSLRWFTRRPRTVVLLSVVLALGWFAVLVLGAISGEVRLPT